MESASALITIDQSGGILSVDRVCCSLFGYAAEELIGQKINILVPSPYREQHDFYLANYLRTGQRKVIGQTRAVEAQRKDGSIFRIRLSVSEVGGSPKYFIGTIDQILDKTATITSTLDGIIISASHNCEQLFGYAVCDLRGKNVKVLMPGAIAARHDDYLRQFRETGRGRVVGHVRNLPARHRTGYVFPVSLKVEPVTLGHTHILTASIERVNTEIEAVFTLSSSGYILASNKLIGELLFGYTSEELTGQSISFLIPSLYQRLTSGNTLPVVGASLEVNDGAKWRTSGLRQMEVRHKDGSLFTVEYEVIPFESLGGIQYSGRIRPMEDFYDSHGPAPVMPLPSPAPTPPLQIPETPEEVKEIQVGEYVLKDNLGRGTYGQVKLGVHTTTGERVAVKIMQKDLMDSATLTRSRQEIQILRSLQHPHIIQLIDYSETPTRFNLITEFVSGGELQAYIKAHGFVCERDSRRFFIQIISALAYCHRRSVIHRDVKHKNILLTADLNIKIIDFGLSSLSRPGGSLRSTFCGTPAYAAPEMILAKKYIGPEVDVWSAGVVLFSMLCGRFPFGNVSDIIEGKYTIADGYASPLCLDLIRGLLCVDSQKRLTIDQVISHAWIQDGLNDYPELRPLFQPPYLTDDASTSVPASPHTFLRQSLEPSAAQAAHQQSLAQSQHAQSPSPLAANVASASTTAIGSMRDVSCVVFDYPDASGATAPSASTSSSAAASPALGGSGGGGCPVARTTSSNGSSAAGLYAATALPQGTPPYRVPYSSNPPASSSSSSPPPPLQLPAQHPAVAPSGSMSPAAYAALQQQALAAGCTGMMAAAPASVLPLSAHEEAIAFMGGCPVAHTLRSSTGPSQLQPHQLRQLLEQHVGSTDSTSTMPSTAGGSSLPALPLGFAPPPQQQQSAQHLRATHSAGVLPSGLPPGLEPGARSLSAESSPLPGARRLSHSSSPPLPDSTAITSLSANDNDNSGNNSSNNNNNNNNNNNSNNNNNNNSNNDNNNSNNNNNNNNSSSNNNNTNNATNNSNNNINTNNTDNYHRNHTIIAPTATTPKHVTLANGNGTLRFPNNNNNKHASFAAAAAIYAATAMDVDGADDRRAAAATSSGDDVGLDASGRKRTMLQSVGPGGSDEDYLAQRKMREGHPRQQLEQPLPPRLPPAPESGTCSWSLHEDADE